MADLLQHVKESGFPYSDRLIHVFVGGSELHGAKVQGTDDLDIYGVYIEPPEMILGLESFPHFVWSTAGDDRRNGPNDVDVTLYSLNKWAGLACKGNPTALHFLFAKGVVRDAAWARIVRNKSIFLAQGCAKQFLGFADDQLKRMTGQKGRGKKGERPEIERKYGYDVKAAMHALRLLYECKEIVSEGTITLPRPERDFLIRVRTGKYTMDKVIATANSLFAECEEAAKSSSLPERVDRVAVSRLLAESYQKAWDAAH
jgi:predicted nucleotidyltransferase